MCLLLVLLVAGAASYTHGSRYALVGHGPFLTAPAPAADSSHTLAEVPRVQATSPEKAGPQLDPESMERDCCERRQAPRGEPAPLRTGAVDTPPELPRESSAGARTPGPYQPDLPVLTVIQLSVSRT